MIEKELLKQMLEELKVISAKTTSKKFRETVSSLYEGLMIYGSLTERQEKLLCEIYKNLGDRNKISSSLYPEVKPCEKCNELGIVQLVDNPNVFLLCDCPQGEKQSWKLPKISQARSLDFIPVPHEQFMPPVRPKSQREISRFTMEKVSWWKEKVRTAEQYWVNNPLEAQGAVLTRIPYKD